MSQDDPEPPRANAPGTLASKDVTQATDAMQAASRWDKAFQEEVVYQQAANPIAEMPSCLNLFDDWAVCFALGPQIRHVYRYGYPTDCAAKLESFKFCLSLKGRTDEERYDAWIRRRAELVTSQRLTQSSEDIWESRGQELLTSDAKADASAGNRKKGWFGL